MRVKFINYTIGMFRGGGETYDLNMAKGLQEWGCEVSFITRKPLFGDVKYPIEEFRTEYIPCPYLRDLSQKISAWDSLFFHCLPKNKLEEFSQKACRYVLGRIASEIYKDDFWFFEKKAYSFLKNNKKDYDIVQIIAMPALASRIVNELKIPAVVRFPGPPSIKYKREIEKCSAVISSGGTTNIIKKDFKKDVYDIPPGIDRNLFRPVKSNVREEYGIDDNPLLLFVGRFVPLKNLPFLIIAFREVIKTDNRTKLMLVGEGPLDKIVRRLVVKYKVEKNVILTGRIPPERLSQYYSAADVFILSSFYESFSIATLEAMSCSLPVIATRVGWLPRLVTSGINGYLVKNNDVDGLKNAVLNLLNDQELCQEMGKRNRKLVKERYDWLESANKLREIYEKLLSKKES